MSGHTIKNIMAVRLGRTGNLTGTGSLTLDGTGSVGFTGNNPDFAGTIKAILVENGQPVEYGQPLFLIE